MNAELIKALRHCTSDGDFDHCEHCKIRVCSEEGMIKILDALEAADKRVKEINSKDMADEKNTFICIMNCIQRKRRRTE